MYIMQIFVGKKFCGLALIPRNYEIIFSLKISRYTVYTVSEWPAHVYTNMYANHSQTHLVFLHMLIILKLTWFSSLRRRLLFFLVFHFIFPGSCPLS